MRRRFRQLTSLAFFFAIPALSAFAPLLALPAISSAFGSRGWASVSIGLSLGLAGSTIAELGWGVTGPQAVAKSNTSDRSNLYYRSIASKLVSLAIIAPVAGILTSVVASSFRFDSAILAFASAAGALSSSWIFVGMGRPLLILATDTVPRVAFLCISAAAIFFGAPLLFYPVAIFGSVVITHFLQASRLGYRPWPFRHHFAKTRSIIASQGTVLYGRLITTGYTSLTVAFVALVAPPAVPLFAAVERIMRMSATCLSGVPSRLQSWLGRPRDVASQWVSIAQCLLINAVLGVLAAIIFALCAPIAVHLLFSDIVHLTFATAALSGTVLGIICLSRGIGLALVAINALRAVSLASVGAAAVGVPALFILPPLFGVDGAIAAEILAESVGAIIQLFFLIRAFRMRQHSEQRA